MTQVAIPQRLMPEDVANVALFLASNDSHMITGQNFTIDGVEPIEPAQSASTLQSRCEEAPFHSHITTRRRRQNCAVI